jgi:hypothetical protein
MASLRVTIVSVALAVASIVSSAPAYVWEPEPLVLAAAQAEPLDINTASADQAEGPAGRQTAIIHGTAFGDAEFQKMRKQKCRTLCLISQFGQ